MTYAFASQSSVTTAGPTSTWVPFRASVDFGESALSVRSTSRDSGAAKALTSPTTVEKRTTLLTKLSVGIQRASTQGLDLPSSEAISRAEALLSRLVIAVQDVTTIEVFVADDGTIEITASPSDRFITIDVGPLSARVSMVVQDGTGERLWADLNATEAEVVRQFERAA